MGAKFSFSINSSGDDSEAVAQQKGALMPLNSVFKDRQHTFRKNPLIMITDCKGKEQFYARETSVFLLSPMTPA